MYALMVYFSYQLKARLSILCFESFAFEDIKFIEEFPHCLDACIYIGTERANEVFINNMNTRGESICR